jgi:ferredoxin
VFFDHTPSCALRFAEFSLGIPQESSAVPHARPIEGSSAHQRRVGGVYDGVGHLFGSVALRQLESLAARKRDLHGVLSVVDVWHRLPIEERPGTLNRIMGVVDSRRWSAQETPMPIVTVEGEKSFEVEPGKKLVLAIEDAGIDIMHKCGGNARCTTCRVHVLSGEPSPMEELERERLAREADLAPDIRLSCQIRVESDLTVGVVNRSSAMGMPAGARPLD